MNIRSQVADVTKPLAATSEMVDGGNMVIMHRRGGVVKSVGREVEEKILKMVEKELILTS